MQTNSDSVKQHERSSLRRTTPQIFVAIAFGFLILGISTIWAMPTIVLGALRNVNGTSEIPLTKDQESWFGSIMYIAQPLGSLASGYLQEVIGRRSSMILVNIPQVAAWIIIVFATSVEELYIGVAIMGLSVGFLEAPSLSYLGEVCEPHLRGTLASLTEVFFVVGMLGQFSTGAALYWRHSCAVAIIIPIPESPTWYMAKGRTNDAEKSLQWLRGWVTKEEIHKELNDLSLSVSQDYVFVPNKELGDEFKVKLRKKSLLDHLKLLKEFRVYRPVYLVSVMFFTGHAVSLLGVRPFMIQLFSDLKLGETMTEYNVLIFSGVAQVLGGLGCIIFIHKVGKRKLVFTSYFFSAVTSLLLGLYIWTNLEVAWIPISLFGANFFFGALGIVSIVWTLVTEVFPTDARGMAAGIVAALSYCFAFIITKSYGDLRKLIGLPGVFVLYGVVGFIGLIYCYFKMPETEGKSIADIECFYKDVNSRAWKMK